MVTKKLESKQGLKIGFGLFMTILFVSACANGVYGIYKLMDNMSQPLDYTVKHIDSKIVVTINSPNIPWNVIEWNLPLLIFQVVLFTYCIINEDRFPITLRGNG